MDCTLRDGEQTNGVSFLPHEKLMIARMLLHDINVDRIEVASARVSEGEKDAVARICRYPKGTRLRPSYFPFTEPSVEVDVSCFECGGKGCPLCKHTGWIEVLGGGVVNRKVLENCNIDPDEYSGFAFGIGIERIAMLKYGINNIGLMFENNLQFLKQFHE